MKNQYQPVTSCFFISVLIFSSFCLNAATRTFDGGGDGTSWHDPDNWSSNTEPTDDDEVIIPANYHVIISQSGEEARTVTLKQNSSLTLKDYGELYIDNDTQSDGVYMEAGTLVSIGKHAFMHIEDTDGDAMECENATIHIYGTLRLGPDIGDDGIDIDEPCVIKIFKGGLLETDGDEPINEDFIDVDGNGDGTEIHVYGTIDVDMDGEGDEVFDFDRGVLFVNYSSGKLKIRDSDDNVFDLNDSDILVKNFGRMEFDEAGDDGFDIDDGGKVINYYGGSIIMNEMDDEGFDLFDESEVENHGVYIFKSDDPDRGESTEAGINADDDSKFTNYWVVKILNVEDNSAIDIEDDAIIENVSGIMTLSLDASLDEPVIEIDEDGQLINRQCGIINITSEHEIDIEDEDASILNEGIITTVFTGTNNNEGTFTNDGVISAPGGVFMISPNPLVGSGIVNSGPIPAEEPLGDNCPTAIPTLSQWGLILLSMCLLILGVVVIRNKRSKRFQETV